MSRTNRTADRDLLVSLTESLSVSPRRLRRDRRGDRDATRMEETRRRVSIATVNDDETYTMNFERNIVQLASIFPMQNRIDDGGQRFPVDGNSPLSSSTKQPKHSSPPAFVRALTSNATVGKTVALEQFGARRSMIDNLLCHDAAQKSSAADALSQIKGHQTWKMNTTINH
jgi:hypothetical protein